MTKRLNNPIRRTKRSLARVRRAIIPLRQSGGASIISIPKSIREAIEVQIGDRLLIEFNPETAKIEISKDTEGNRERALYQSKNLDIIGDRIRDAHEADDRDRWEQKVEKVLWGLLNHLKGDKLDKSTDDDDNDSDDDREDL